MGKEGPFFQIRKSRREGKGEEGLFARLKPHPLLLPSSAGALPSFSWKTCLHIHGGGRGRKASFSLPALLAPSSHHHQPSMPEWNRRRRGEGGRKRKAPLSPFLLLATRFIACKSKRRGMVVPPRWVGGDGGGGGGALTSMALSTPSCFRLPLSPFLSGFYKWG